MSKCPKCHSEVLDECCLKCGYMANGNNVSLEEAPDQNRDIKLFNADFEKMCRNDNYYIPMLIGPFYFSYRNIFWLGFIFGIIDFVFLLLAMQVASYFSYISIIIIIIYIVFNRLMYASFANELCLLIDKVKIKRIKNKYGETYQEKLILHHNSFFKIILTMELYILIFFIIVYILRYC